MSELSPLPVEKQKLDFGAVRAAFDPQQTPGISHKAATPLSVLLGIN